MRVQKSVYYMTDRELRIYKRQLRRRRQLQRRIVTMLATICVIAFCAVSYHGIRSLASSGEDQLKFKYYTQVTVAYGETLWDLSDDYIDYDEYKNKKEYIAEVQSINHLAEEDSIRAGQTLIVPYYSYDFCEVISVKNKHDSLFFTRLLVVRMLRMSVRVFPQVKGISCLLTALFFQRCVVFSCGIDILMSQNIRYQIDIAGLFI